MIRLVSVLLLMLAAASGPALAGDSRSVYPDIPRATGPAHPEGNLFMRTNHMALLRHDRDLTMRQGQRDIGSSLKECVDCHAVNGPDAEPVGFDDDKHFCRVCHDYVAVKVDCFMCHNSKPQASDSALLGRDQPDPDGIETFLAGVKQ